MAPRKPVPARIDIAAPATTAPPPPARPARQRPGRERPLVVNLPQASATAATQPGDAPDLRLPHERDQSAVDATADTPDPVVAQAARDLAAGLVDTDLRNPGGLDGPRRQQLLRAQK